MNTTGCECAFLMSPHPRPIGPPPAIRRYLRSLDALTARERALTLLPPRRSSTRPCAACPLCAPRGHPSRPRASSPGPPRPIRRPTPHPIRRSPARRRWSARDARPPRPFSTPHRNRTPFLGATDGSHGPRPTDPTRGPSALSDADRALGTRTPSIELPCFRPHDRFWTAISRDTPTAPAPPSHRPTLPGARPGTADRARAPSRDRLWHAVRTYLARGTFDIDTVSRAARFREGGMKGRELATLGAPTDWEDRVEVGLGPRLSAPSRDPRPGSTDRSRARSDSVPQQCIIRVRE